MVTGVAGHSRPAGMGGFQPPQPLTEAQTEQIKTILSEYDPEAVTAEQAQAIFQSFRAAGLRPGPGMREAIEAAGFDAQELRQLGRPEGRGGPAGQSINPAALQSLQSILEQYDLANLSGADEDAMLAQLKDAGLLRTGYMLDLSV